MDPVRSVLSVPGHIEKMHHKAKDSSADVIMFDLEDSVPVNEKDKARVTVINTLNNNDYGTKTITYRINPLDTKYAYKDIIEIGLACPGKYKRIVIPKVSGPEDIHFADKLLDGIEMDTGREYSAGIEASVETAQGLENISEIAKASARLYSLVFGIADYSASVGAKLASISGHGEGDDDIYPGHRWNYVLSRIAMAAKSNGLFAIDAPYGNFSDDDGLSKNSMLSAALGFDGKWAIHPNQLDTINRIFSPTAEEINFALMIINAADDGNVKGAVNVGGRMVDRATVRLARRTWELALRLGLTKLEE